MKQAQQACLVACAALLVSTTVARAQLSSSISDNFSSGFSDALSSSSSSDGLNGSFDSSTSNLTNTFVRTDISDPTHSMLDGSAISSLDNSYVDSSVTTQPRTQVLTDAQMAVGFGDESFGGRQSRAFAAGANSFRENGSSRTTSGNSVGGGLTKSAFSGSLTGRAAFSSQSAADSTSGGAFSGSGEVSSAALDPTYATTQSLASVSLADGTRAQLSVDPVFANSVPGVGADAANQGDMSQPSSEAGEFFALTQPMEQQYQYDDGQTPVLGGPLVPGRIIGTTAEYGVGKGGFSDSTRGLAGQPMEGMGSLSPFPSLTLTGDSPFKSFTDGSVYEPSPQLSPSLHGSGPMKNVEAAALARARRAEQKRIEMGMSTSESEEIYLQDLKHARSPGRRDALHDTVHDSMSDALPGSSGGGNGGH